LKLLCPLLSAERNFLSISLMSADRWFNQPERAAARCCGNHDQQIA